VFTDLPKDGLFFPAIQNKSKLLKNVLKVNFKFELSVPKDKSQIPSICYSSSEEDNEDDDGMENEDNNLTMEN
jgi:hypothetical protein